MNETPSLEQTLDLFAAGVDDVVRKPIHIREILARVGAIRRRHEGERDSAEVGELRVFFDGRDPQLRGAPLPLPRRERRILEYLVNNRGGASARLKSSIPSMEFSTKMSKRTWLKAISASCAKNCAASLVTPH
jgi:DNA-binding response OmpR family regulator